MEPNIDIKLLNPWHVESLYDFSYFCCPECDSKWQSKQDFVNHALHRHPQAMTPLQSIKDGSIQDIKFPDPSEIKIELDSREELGEALGSEPNKPVIQRVPKAEVGDALEAKYDNTSEDLMQAGDEEFLDDLPNDDISDIDDDSDFGGEDELRADLQCAICKESFDEADSLEHHECSEIAEDYETKPNRKKKKTSSKAGFSCDICDFTAKTPKFLIAHVKNIHKNKESLGCSECNETFPSVGQLRLHLAKEHRMSRKPEKCLCTLCGKTLIGRSNLKKHEREKHGIDNAKFIRKDRLVKIECLKCEEKFDSVAVLDAHLIECTGESNKFPCINCDTKWANGYVLNIHLKVDHQMTEIHTCDKCGKCLKKKVSLSSHIKVDHENIKDHVCHLCGRGFARQQGLQFHIKRVHENSGKHFCDRCSFKAITKPELEIHINEVHTKAIKFHCQQCNFFCYRKGGLAAHVKNVHLKLRPHQCDTCGQAFVRRKELEKHKEWSNHS